MVLKKGYSVIHAEFWLSPFSEHWRRLITTAIMVVVDDNDPGTMRRLSVSCSTFWHFGHGLTTKPVFNKLRKEIGEWHDVLPDACLFQSGHIGVPPLQWHHCPAVSACREHHVHKEAADTAIAVHIRMDIDEDEMAEHNSYWTARTPR